MANIILLIFSVILCVVAVFISYTGIKLYNEKEKDKNTFYKQFLSVPAQLKYTFVFNIFCVITVLTIFIMNIL